MTREELQEAMVNDAKDMGYIWTSRYIEMFGYEEPLYGPTPFESHYRRREAIAKECVEKGKTATELGYYSPEHLKDVLY